MSRLLPMFPLGTVLLPGERLPVHVFEPRYRALVADVRAGDGRFGVALIERGSEVGGGDVRTDVGTEVELEYAEEYPDGRWGLVVLGVGRVRVVRWEPDDPYPRAQVQTFDDTAPVTALDPDVISTVQGTVRRVLALAAEAGLSVTPSTFALPGEDEALLWQLASLVPIGPFDRQRLLVADAPERRVGLLTAMLDDVEAALRHRLTGESGV